MTASKEEVKCFLEDFKIKSKTFQILFRDDRGKNFKTLAELDIRAIDREKYLFDLQVDEYSEGPLEEKLYNGSDMWVFGKLINRQMVYIKVSILSKATMCISFHLAERTMSFPFK